MKKGNIEFISAMLIFGFNGVLANVIPWRSYEIVLSRTVIGSLMMLLIMLIKGKKFTFQEDKKSFKMIVFSGIFMGMSWLFLYEAYRRLGVGLAQILSSSGSVLAMVLAPFIFKEKLIKHKIMGFVIVAAGMVLISSNDLTGGVSFGLFCGISACLTYTAFLICNRLATSIQGHERTMWQLFVASIIVLGFVIYQGSGMPTDFSPKSIIAILVLGIVNTGFAMNLMFTSLPKLSLQTITIYTYLEPMSALLFSALFLGERMLALQMIGVVLILGGTAFSEFYPSLARRKHIG